MDEFKKDIKNITAAITSHYENFDNITAAIIDQDEFSDNIEKQLHPLTLQSNED